jgi:pyridinium-3,5-biscarboxylic acid mononucleotide synthase
MTEFDLDFQREERLGFDEAIYCGAKNSAQIAAILGDAARHQGRFLLTRLSAEKFMSITAEMRGQIDFDPLSQTGIYGSAKPIEGPARVAILTAGTSDITVGREALRTLNYYGVAAQEFNDIGVAGLWRLTQKLDAIRTFPIAIVVAGMDAALVSVAGGLLASVMIAVPTSIGYGVASGGETALHSALASCAPGVVVVNIDNGYGAACAALRVLRFASLGHSSPDKDKEVAG